MGVILLNGVSSKSVNIEVQRPPEDVIPEREYIVTSIMGRSGDVVVDTQKYKNVDITYNVAMDATDIPYSKAVSMLNQWLYSNGGYIRIEDDYHPEYYRLGVYKSQANISNIFMQAGVVDLKFNCKPQKFLLSGEEPMYFVGPDKPHDNKDGLEYKINNPTLFDAAPLVRVKCSSEDGILSIEGAAIGFKGGLDHFYIVDCENEDVYGVDSKNVIHNLNNKVVLNEAGDFFKLYPGMNTIQAFGGITHFDIIPRWWIL